MAISGYSVNEQGGSDGNLKDNDCYEDSQHHGFVKVIPMEFPKQKVPNTVYGTQQISSQEELRTYPMVLNEKDQSEMSSIASVSTLSSHVMNRAMSANGAAAAEKPLLPRIPNGQCK